MTELPEQLVMPCPFAGGAGAELATIPGDITENEVNFTEGFPSVYSAPKSNNGKYVKRSELNAIGNMGTKNDFYRMCGGINTFNPEFCTAVGGYPKGAILDYFDGVNLNKVLSLEEDNTQDFRQGVFANKWVLLNSPEPNLGQITIGKWTMSGTDAFLVNALSIASFKAPRSGVVVCNVSNIQYGSFNTSSSNNVFFGSCILAIASSTDTFSLPSTSSYGNWKNIFTLPASESPAIGLATAKIDAPSGVVACSAGDFVSICYQNGIGGMKGYSFDIEVSIM